MIVNEEKGLEKRSLIINSLRALIIDGKGSACSVSDIAKRAGIGKGSIYYYFHSKEDILEALIDHDYSSLIEKCHNTVEESNLPAIPKIALLFQSYYSHSVDNKLDQYLHEPANAYIHQMSLSKILLHMSPILADIIRQGVEESIFICPYPEEFAEMVIAELCFVLDPGIFSFTNAERTNKLHALGRFVEKALEAPVGSFSFL